MNLVALDHEGYYHRLTSVTLAQQGEPVDAEIGIDPRLGGYRPYPRLDEGADAAHAGHRG